MSTRQHKFQFSTDDIRRSESRNGVISVGHYSHFKSPVQLLSKEELCKKIQLENPTNSIISIPTISTGLACTYYMSKQQIRRKLHKNIKKHKKVNVKKRRKTFLL
jgi:hypothetical protein